MTYNYTDLVIGGPPCQSLSNANRNNNSKMIDDNKNKLILDFINIIKEIKPLVFVFENVPQVVTAGDGQFLKEFKEQLSSYHIEIKVLNSIDYNTPQKRKRAIIIGSKIGVIKHPEPIKNNITVKEAFKNLNWNIYNQLDFSMSNKKTIEKMSHIKPGGNWEDIPNELKGKREKGKTHSNSYRRLKWEEPSVTITNFRKTMILHPDENRILSVREAARLQGFPDDYIFLGNLSSKQQQVANAVPVTMSYILASSIMEQMIKHLPQNKSKRSIL